jgi:hypothetical protein
MLMGRIKSVVRVENLVKGLRRKRDSGRHTPDMPSFPVTLGLVFVAALAGAWLIFVGFAELSGFHIGIWPDVRSPLPKSRLFDLTRSTVTAAGLLVGVFAVVYAYRKQRIEEANSHRADSDSLGARYQEAAEQLGHERAAVRLAGVYALSRLADSDSTQRLTICRLLCAYLRMPYKPESDDMPGEQEVRFTVIKVITEHLGDPLEETSWCGYDLDFSGAVFDGGSFRGAHFTGGVVDFSGCRFVDGKTHFDDAKFGGAHVKFGDGDSDPAVFNGGDVFFTGAQFTGGRVSFIFAEFVEGEVSFGGAIFIGNCVLSFSSCILAGGQISFGGPVWLGAKLASGKISFRGAQLNSGTLSFIGVDFGGVEVQLDVSLGEAEVVFDEAWFTSGVVSFVGMESINPQISFSGAHTPEKVVTPWPMRLLSS